MKSSMNIDYVFRWLHNYTLAKLCTVLQETV